MACCKENRIHVSEVVTIQYYIGIDLGTSAVKLLLVDEQGRIEREVTKEYPLSFPHPGSMETVMISIIASAISLEMFFACFLFISHPPQRFLIEYHQISNMLTCADSGSPAKSP